ncbi:MAG: hypothetical protein WA755_05095 [Candidatus Acidiferrales bacterium]
MIRTRTRLVLGATAAMLLASGCGSSTTFNPTPTLSNVSPTNITAGSGAFELNVVGLNVLTNTVIDWNGSPRTTTLNSTTGQLVAQILATDIQTPGTAEITIVNPPPGGGFSNGFTFFIDPASNPVPSITGLTPASMAAAGAGFTLTVNGTGFVGTTASSTSAVSWNGSPRATTYVSTTQLTAAILSSDIATAGTANVTVVNPAPGGGVSAPFAFTISSGEAHPAGNVARIAGEFELVSASAIDGVANGPSGAPKMDATGRFIAFQSAATNLLRNGQGSGASILVRDTCNGTPDCTPQTFAADVAPDGSGPNGPAARGLAISADGRYVVFASHATNLTSATAEPATEIYLRDTCLGLEAPQGCAPSTILVSASSSGAADGASEFPSISADGRYVSFASSARNLAAAAKDGTPQVYLRDTCLGSSAPKTCEAHTLLVSQDATGRPGRGASLESAISADGRYVAFDSVAPSLVPSLFNGASNIFLSDTCNGVAHSTNCTPSIRLISTSPTGAAADGASFTPAIGADGRFIAFVTRAGNLVPGANSTGQEIVVHDTCLGGTAPQSCAPATSLVSQQVSGSTHSPAINSDGSLISFVADDVSSGATGTLRGYVRNTCAGVLNGSSCVAHTTLIATSASGKASDLPDGSARFALPINANGTAVAFFSVGPMLSSPRREIVTGSGVGDVFLLTLSAAP